MNRLRTVPFLLALTAFAAVAQPAPTPRTAAAELRDAGGRVVGRATLTETPGSGTPGGVVLRVTLAGFTAARPGEHGLHLHAVGQCAPSFAAAGGHFNPAGRQHGFLSAAGHHAGDLPNVRVDEAGNASYEVRTFLVTLGEGAASLFDADGTSLVLHAGADDLHTDPAGASGDRLACGVLARTP